MKTIADLAVLIHPVCPFQCMRLKNGRAEIDFEPAATPAQLADANTIAAAFDWSAPTSRDTASQNIKSYLAKPREQRVAADRDDFLEALAALIN